MTFLTWPEKPSLVRQTATVCLSHHTAALSLAFCSLYADFCNLGPDPFPLPSAFCLFNPAHPSYVNSKTQPFLGKFTASIKLDQVPLSFTSINVFLSFRVFI